MSKAKARWRFEHTGEPFVDDDGDVEAEAAGVRLGSDRYVCVVVCVRCVCGVCVVWRMCVGSPYASPSLSLPATVTGADYQQGF